MVSPIPSIECRLPDRYICVAVSRNRGSFLECPYNTSPELLARFPQSFLRTIHLFDEHHSQYTAKPCSSFCHRHPGCLLIWGLCKNLFTMILLYKVQANDAMERPLPGPRQYVITMACWATLRGFGLLMLHTFASMLLRNLN